MQRMTLSHLIPWNGTNSVDISVCKELLCRIWHYRIEPLSKHSSMQRITMSDLTAWDTTNSRELGNRSDYQNIYHVFMAPGSILI